METPEQFIQSYLSEMVRIQEIAADAYAPVLESFFATGYKPLNLLDNIERAKAEAIVSVLSKGESFEVVTTGFGEHHRIRYTVVAGNEGFAIALAEWECGLCGRMGSSRANCKFCGGTGWQTLPLPPAASP